MEKDLKVSFCLKKNETDANGKTGKLIKKIKTIHYCKNQIMFGFPKRSN